MSDERGGTPQAPELSPEEVDEAHHEGLYVVGEEVPEPSDVNDVIVIGAAIVAAICGIVFGVGLIAGANMTVYGGALAIGLFALAVAVRRYFAAAYPDIEALEPREIPTEDTEEPITEVGRVGRRSILGRLLAGAGAIFGLSFLAPVASLGPAPGDALRRTAWDAGIRLVTTDGELLRPEDVAEGGVSTVWPEGAIEVENASVVLVRLSAGTRPGPPTNPEWVVDGDLVAYSKVCTHAGCPVGLFRERDNALFCPCHQSTFDAAAGARPTFGPTARALPQLPMGVDEEGYLIALGDFQEQVGPAFG